MSSSERRGLLAAMAALPFVAACGFSPALAPGGAGEAVRGRISVAAPDTRDAYALVARLEERLGRARTADYALSYEITTRTDDLAIQRAEGATRHHLVGRVAYTLTARGGGAPLRQGEVSDFTAWSSTADALSERVAREDAHRRLMRILADRIATRLIASADIWSVPE